MFVLRRYLSEKDVKTLDFQQLVGGVIWMIRNGRSVLMLLMTMSVVVAFNCRIQRPRYLSAVFYNL